MPEPEPRTRRSADHPERRVTSETTRRRVTSATAREPTTDRTEDGQAGSGRNEVRSLNARHAAALAAQYVRELTGRPPEGVTSLEHDSDGWQIGIEALESRRVPDSTDILALYLVILDRDGELISYRRERRYHRSRPEEGLP